MGRTRHLDAVRSRPARIELLVVELMNRLLEAGAEELDQRLGEVLARLGEACGLDRTFLFRSRADGTHFNSHEWVAAGVVPLKDQMQTLVPTDHAFWHASLRNGQAVAIRSREDLPKASPERAFLERIGVWSSLMVPIRDGGRLVGFIGYDSQSPQRPWAEDETYLLTSVGRAVGSVLLRREAAAAEEAARRHLEATLRALPDLVIEIDPDGRITACHSDKLPWLSGLVHAGVGRHLSEVLPEPLAQVLVEVLGNVTVVQTARTRRVGLLSLVAPQWYEVSVAPLHADAGQGRAGAVAVIRDLSANAASSEMASYREGQFTAFFEMCPHPILLNDFDTGEVLDGNRAFKQVFGLDLQQSPGLSVRNILTDDNAWVIDTAAAALKATGSYGPLHADLRRTDGQRFSAVLRGFMSIDPNGRRLVWALIEDVTEIREQQVALVAERRTLEATRSRFVAAIEALDDGFAIFDADDRLVLWNQPYIRVFAPIAHLIKEGALYDDLLRAAIAHGVFGPDGMRDESGLQRRLDRPLTEIWDAEDELADGRLIWVRERATPERETVGLYEDVTARRLADRRLQQVVEGGEVAVWDWDVETGLSAMNDRWQAMLGFPDNQATLPHLLALVHHEDLRMVLDMHRSLFRRGTDDFDLLCRLRHRNGRWVWLLSRGRVLARRAGGSPRRISGVTLDVSARIEAEQSLTRLIDGARVGTWEYSFDEGRTLVNDRWAEIVGYRAADVNPVKLDRWLEMIHPDDAKEMLAKEARSFAAGQWRVEHEMRLRHRDGHWVWVLSRGQVIEWDAAGRPLRITGVHLDISEAKALEVELARERDTLARIMETSVSGIVAVDGRGRVVFANAAAEVVLGRPIAAQDDLAAVLAEASVTDLDGNPVELADFPVSLALSGSPALHDVRHAIHWPCTMRRVLSVNAARLSAPGTDLAVVCSFTDITAAMESEDRLRAAMTAAEAANRAKSDFLAAMSHEIRTPLNGVLGMAHVMERGISDPEQQAMLRVIRESGEHLLGVINDILDLAKIEAGRLALEAGPVRLCDVVARIAALHRLRAEEKGIRLTTASHGAPEDQVRLGDEMRVIQILHNLVGNAIKFTEAGEVALTVDASSSRRLVIEVRDTGIGMTEAEVAQVFEDFTQGQGGIARRYGGTGLGLSIVRRLAHLMRGEVTLKTSPGQGLTARVEIDMPVLDSAGVGKKTATIPKLPPMTVLAAEDNATNRLILSSMLQALGVAVEIVSNGEEALSRWRVADYDAVLLDIAMPGRDGIATLSDLRALAANEDRTMPPVIAVTANAMTHQVQDYLDRGFTDFVAKPIRLEHLAEALLNCRSRITQR